jgi:hypothetical protein
VLVAVDIVQTNLIHGCRFQKYQLMLDNSPLSDLRKLKKIIDKYSFDLFKK